MPAPGERAKLVNALDNQMSDELGLEPLYRIEVAVALSQKGVKAGAIVVFRLNNIEMDFESKLNPKKFDPKVIEKANEMQDFVNKQTEVMFRDPEYFKETEGRWLPWAMDRALELYDQFHGNASIALKCPQLKVRRVRSPKAVANLRSNPRELFPEVSDIDALLERGFNYDPWSKTIRRGRINAEMSKR
jgi:hypothetical protein